LNYREPLVQRDKHLLRDIESETLYLRTLLGRLDNYGEASADR
jgi:hypothetical protein